MKIYILPILLFVSFLWSCDDSDDVKKEETEEVSLSASPTSITFEAAGGTEVLSITSDTNWKINYDTDSWLSTNIQASAGNADVTITAEENETSASREEVLTITADGADDVTITITQDAGEVDTSELAYIDPDNTDMRELTSIQFSQLIDAGWNLGNSLESINASNGTYSGNETTWGNPTVTQQLIDSVKAAGFNAVRIPVSWSHQLVDNATYEIDETWMERVEQVVNYVVGNDMYAIINVHWDGGWMDNPYYTEQDSINTKLETFWKQIAIHFRDYSDYLLFAGTNEVHLEDYSAPSTENIAVQNSFNKTFVDAVRSTGGRNAYRQLIIQAFNTNIGYAVDYLTIPSDTIANKLMVEVHFYDPYEFALQESGEYNTQWGKNYVGGDVTCWGQEDWVDEAFGDMKTNFVDKGYAVILGEYGALLRTNLGDGEEDHVAARNYYLGYITKAAKDNGLVPFYWDNGNTGNNGFGLFNRSNGQPVHEDAIAAIINATNE